MRITNFKSTSNLTELDDFIRFCSIDLELFLSTINGNVDLLDNCSTALVSVSFRKANTTYPFSHGLGRVPKGYITASLASSAVIFDGNSLNTIKQIFLQSSAITSGKVLVF